jgi:hypothetical protein
MTLEFIKVDLSELVLKVISDKIVRLGQTICPHTRDSFVEHQNAFSRSKMATVVIKTLLQNSTHTQYANKELTTSAVPQ